MSPRNLNDLTAALQQGKLTAHDQAQLEAYLAEHPDQVSLYEEDLTLHQLLRQIPDMPVSSNFTVQVMQAIHRDDLAKSPAQISRWPRVLAGRWFPKLATTAVVLCAGLFAYHEHKLANRREIAREIAELHNVTSAATLEVLQNFDAIERMNQIHRDPDNQLITALQ
jgi:anti-sigma factor RsiW